MKQLRPSLLSPCGVLLTLSLSVYIFPTMVTNPVRACGYWYEATQMLMPIAWIGFQMVPCSLAIWRRSRQTFCGSLLLCRSPKCQPRRSQLSVNFSQACMLRHGPLVIGILYGNINVFVSIRVESESRGTLHIHICAWCVLMTLTLIFPACSHFGSRHFV